MKGKEAEQYKTLFQGFQKSQKNEQKWVNQEKNMVTRASSNLQLAIKPIDMGRKLFIKHL